MDLISVLKPFFDFFVKFCNITVYLGGFSFTVGSLFVWSLFVCVLIGFMKGLAK